MLLSCCGNGEEKYCDSYTTDELYQLFQNPPQQYRPFVRWWWNGNKVEIPELIRELYVLDDAGIGGVEINSIEFPTHGDDDMGKESLLWLSDEWMECVKVVADTAKSLGLTCDLLVGSGWPIGGDFVPDNERCNIISPHAIVVDGPCVYNVVHDEIVSASLPAVNSPNNERNCKIISLIMVPNPCDDMSQVVDLLPDFKGDTLSVDIPEGSYTISAVVLVNNFMRVIDGAPGADGPVVNHYDKNAVNRYLYRMSNTLKDYLDCDLSDHFRAMFMDSMELEGSNWSDDFAEEFESRRGYDVMPYLNFILWKTRGMGDPVSYKPLIATSDSLSEIVKRVRYDFELTKAELLRENFTEPYAEWCKSINLKSRGQAYGRGFFPLESSMSMDIPECESWTTNWLKHKPGEEMSETDYRRGRAYTMINKYVSSAAHLTDKKVVSCEEMTNTYNVFNMSLQQLKIGGDMGIVSGVTHSVFHGFNYMPQNAEFPGWIRYGAYYNENNNWWKYFHLYNDYKARIYSVLQNSTNFADIAILNPDGDMWTNIGMQNEPFPNTHFAQYKTLIWEAVVKNGGACDYVSEQIIDNASFENGCMIYNNRRYNTLFLLNVESMSLKTARQLVVFAEHGGKIICVETIPHLALGLHENIEDADNVVDSCLNVIRNNFEDNFVFVNRPDSNFVDWYADFQQKHQLPHAVSIDNPDDYIMQTHYVTDDDNDVFFICNCHRYDEKEVTLSFDQSCSENGKKLFLWNAESGEKYVVPNISNDGSYVVELILPPATSNLLVFEYVADNQYDMCDVNVQRNLVADNLSGWNVRFNHSRENVAYNDYFDTLFDVSCMDKYRDFTGTIVYTKAISLVGDEDLFIDLGLVEGVSELYVTNVKQKNPYKVGVRWYGKHCYEIPADVLIDGDNVIEIHVVTTLGNYAKSLTDNPVAQYWTNKGSKNQPTQPMGLMGPVKIYSCVNY